MYVLHIMCSPEMVKVTRLRSRRHDLHPIFTATVSVRYLEHDVVHRA